MEKGDIVYIVENRRKVTEVVIRSITENLFTVLLPTGGEQYAFLEEEYIRLDWKRKSSWYINL